MDRVTKLASQKAVVIFSKSSCCMCHSVKTLFGELGVDATIYELDEEPWGLEIEKALLKHTSRNNKAVPAVYIGGKLVGATDKIMSLHLGNMLVPLLRDAGAIWL